MAELTTTDPSAASCEQADCCAPAEKASCCGPEHEAGTCGCAAGSTANDDELREAVRARYAAAAAFVAAGQQEPGSCCGPVAAVTTDAADAQGFGGALYGAGEAAAAPAAAVTASLGCGVPTAVADLHEGETVLDLGSGAGADVLISAKRVGPTGKAIGLDMTDEMLDLARRNVAEAGVGNVELLRGHIEDVPLPAATVDVVISNCVINLSTDKAAVFAEMFRILRPGGRVGVSDVVAEDRLSPADRAERGDYAGCIAGALSVTEYEQGLRTAGFEEVSITFTHEVADGLHGAVVRATRPS